MKLNPLSILAACALALAGCSSTPTKVDSGQIHARTFSFVNPGPGATPDYAEKRQAVHKMIQDAIAKNLAARGVTKADAGGDVTVGYLVIIGNNATTKSISTYFGYGEDAAGLQDEAHKAYNSSKNPNYFEAGTLVIDIIDSRTYKLLKRGYASRPILRSLPDDARAARIQQVVDQVLGDVRIAP